MPTNKERGCWIFLSHSSRDIEKVRFIRNEFEKYGHNPLAFHLLCLTTDTEEGRRECLLLRELLHAKDRAMMQDISEEEELLLRRLLSRMRNNILNLLENAPDGVER